MTNGFAHVEHVKPMRASIVTICSGHKLGLGFIGQYYGEKSRGVVFVREPSKLFHRVLACCGFDYYEYGRAVLLRENNLLLLTAADNLYIVGVEKAAWSGVHGQNLFQLVK